MNKTKWALLLICVAMIAGAGQLLRRLGSIQKLGIPGIKAEAIPGQVVVHLALPERVLDYTSSNVVEDISVTNMLPQDTSYAQRRYFAPDGFWVNSNLILMGTDRTSIHKPEFCLPGQGWRIDTRSVVPISVQSTPTYQMPVAKWLLTATVKGRDGQSMTVRGLYVFWFVAEGEQTVSHWQRIWWLARDLLCKGVLQRWAYVSYFTVFSPGQEDQSFERVKQLIEASVPAYQIPPKAVRSSELATKDKI